MTSLEGASRLLSLAQRMRHLLSTAAMAANGGIVQVMAADNQNLRSLRPLGPGIRSDMSFVRQSFLFAATLSVAAALLAGCGGGGGAQSSTAAPATVDVQAAVTALLQTGGTFHSSCPLAGTSTVADMTNAFIPGAPPNAAFSGALATTHTATGTSTGPVTIVPSTETFYYTTNPVRIVGLASSSGSLVRFTPTTDFPTAASIGQSGQFAAGTQDQSTQFENLNWSVEASDVANTAWVCLHFVQIRTQQAQCVLVTPVNALVGYRVVTDLGGLGGPVNTCSSTP
jgi:hypothetical protein